MNKQIEYLISESVRELELLRHNKHEEFQQVPPVLWFGDITSNKEKILVISANPNKPEEPQKAPRLPYCKNWKNGERDVSELAKQFNEYFAIDRNPFTAWFGANPNTWTDVSQGHIEGFLSGLDASFYGGNKYQAIHIDLLPFSTKPHFAEIADKIMGISGLPEWINRHLHQLIELIQPKLIIVNGGTNFHYFNLLINLDAQPYGIYKLYDGCTLWKAADNPNRPPIIGLSLNMGSRCCLKWWELQALGKETVEKTNIKL